MKRIPPGPFGGAFDDLPYDHPAFDLWVLTTAALLLVFVATVWALIIGRRRRRRDIGRTWRGFEVVVGPGEVRVAGESTKEE